MRKLLFLLPLLWLTVACGKENNSDVVEEVSLPVTVEPPQVFTTPNELLIDIRTQKMTAEFVQQVIAKDQECLQASFDTYGMTIIVLDSYDLGRQACPGGDGCYNPDTNTIVVPAGNAYGVPWDAELLAHELNHAFLKQTAEPHDGDPNHTHAQIFGRRDGAYGWNTTDHNTVSECVAKAFGA